ncbi:hypothetical protein HYV11_00965 [Candidatus Dependentiae bacterium]|nr:hypothetical protein [Candidatus Dependentiae bacterium]
MKKIFFVSYLSIIVFSFSTVKSISFFSNFIKSKKIMLEELSSLFDKVFIGDKKALSKIDQLIKKMNFKDIAGKNGFLKDVLKKLQDNADMQMKKLDKKVKKDLDEINSRNILDDENAIKKQIEIGKMHTKENDNINQRSQEIIAKLQPLCSDSQKILFSVDRKNNNQLINLVDLKDVSPDNFHIDSDKKSNDVTLSKAKADTLNALSESHQDLQIPKHYLTKPTFFDQLKDASFDYHSSLHAQHKLNIGMGLEDDDLKTNSLEKLSRKNTEFRNLVQTKMHKLFMERQKNKELSNRSERNNDSFEDYHSEIIVR